MADILSHSTLKTSLVSYWELEEASGVRYDSHSGNNLTDNNTVGTATGIIGNGADFESTNSEYLSISDGSQSGLDLTGDNTIAFWYKPESVTSGVSYTIVSKWSDNQRSYFVQFRNDSGTHKIRGAYSDDGVGTGTGLIAVNISTLSTGTWYHVVVTFDVSANEMEVFLDGVSQGTVIGTSITSIADDTGTFAIGCNEPDDTPTQFTDGVVDEVGIWSKILTSGEITDLYNSGAGLPYIDASDVANSYLDTNLVSYWELEEASGTRVDSKGSNNLADNNTVGQGTGIQGSCGDFESGNSEYLSISDASQTGIDSTTAYSIQTWVKFESLSANMSPISKGNDSVTGLFQVFWLTSNNIVFRRVTASGSPGGREGITHSWTPSTGTWYHLVFTFSTTNGSEMYIDGSSVATDTATDAAIDTTEQFTIGCRSRNGGTAIDMYFDGLIDEVGFWDREITAGEVSALYNGGTSIPYEAAAAATFTPKTVMF